MWNKLWLTVMDAFAMWVAAGEQLGRKPLNYREFKTPCINNSYRSLKLYQQLQKYMSVPLGQLAMLESVDSDSLAIGRGIAELKVQ